MSPNYVSLIKSELHILDLIITINLEDVSLIKSEPYILDLTNTINLEDVDQRGGSIKLSYIAFSI
jgi:hypothetical protein